MKLPIFFFPQEDLVLFQKNTKHVLFFLKKVQYYIRYQHGGFSKQQTGNTQADASAEARDWSFWQSKLYGPGGESPGQEAEYNSVK